MQRHPGSGRQPVAKKRPSASPSGLVTGLRPRPPKRAPRPALKPPARVMPKQHRGGR